MFYKFSRGFINTVYDFNDFTINELLCKLAQKMDEVITQSNESFNYLDWLKGQGLSDEFIKILEEWKENGTLETVINEQLFNGLNTKIDNNKTELDENINAINSQLDNKAIYVTPEMFGAKGDGITDDTQSFVQALETSKIFELKQEKVYRITQPINVPNNRILNLNNALILMDYDTTKPHDGRNNHGVFTIRGVLKNTYPIDLDIEHLTIDKGYVNISDINDLKVGDYVIVRVDTGIYSSS